MQPKQNQQYNKPCNNIKFYVWKKLLRNKKIIFSKQQQKSYLKYFINFCVFRGPVIFQYFKILSVEWVLVKKKQFPNINDHNDQAERVWVFSLEKRRLWGDLAAIQYLKWAYKKAREGLFTRAGSDRTRGKGFKLKEGRLRLDVSWFQLGQS